MADVLMSHTYTHTIQQIFYNFINLYILWFGKVQRSHFSFLSPPRPPPPSLTFHLSLLCPCLSLYLIHPATSLWFTNRPCTECVSVAGALEQHVFVLRFYWRCGLSWNLSLNFPWATSIVWHKANRAACLTPPILLPPSVVIATVWEREKKKKVRFILGVFFFLPLKSKEMPLISRSKVVILFRLQHILKHIL